MIIDVLNGIKNNDGNVNILLLNLNDKLTANSIALFANYGNVVHVVQTQMNANQYGSQLGGTRNQKCSCKCNYKSKI